MIDSANYNDKIILNGGVRYDNYDVKASGFGTASGRSSPNLWGAQEVRSGMPNFNLGLTLKPMPIGSVYVAYATSTNPVGSEFDGTSAQYGGLAGFLPGNPNQVFGPEKNKAIEVGTKWELFDRHMLVTAALFQTEKENAREAQNVTSQALRPRSRAACTRFRCQSPSRILHLRRCGLSHPRHRPRHGRQDHRQMERDGGLVLMQSEVTKSLVPPQPLLYPTNVGRPLANVAHQSFSLLTKYQFNDIWELGGQAVYRSQDLRRHFPRRQPGHVDPELLAFRRLRGSPARQELVGENVRRQSHQQALL